MKLPLVLERRTSTSRDLRAGCFVCHGIDAHWTSANAQALAVQHHDRTGHATWCDVYLSVRYGREAADDRQTDIEDAIAASSSGGGPDAAPLTDPDAPTVPAAGVSAPLAAQSKRALAAAKPEPIHA